jgi:nitric oxide reductase activation protein
LDTIAVVETDARSVGPAKKYRAEIRAQVAVIKSRLRAKFLEAKTKRFVHGVRKGTAMSERRIVDSVIEIKSGRVPQRPDFRVELKSDPSLAVSVILDESGSMNRLVKLVTKAAVGVADALDGLGCPVQVIGPRSGADWVAEASGCHRYHSVHIDVFKDWNEGMSKALPRFSHVRADGSTPLEDGIQHALRELNGRSEAHRIILVITDGAPDNSNVVRRQIRLAKEAGIQIVGVAIGPSCHYSVKGLFPDRILVGHELEDLGVRLVSHLESVVFPRRAKAIKIDDPKTRLRSA